jgi:signal transduction histidine kinase
MSQLHVENTGVLSNRFLLATLPPSKRQIAWALGIVLALVVAFGTTAPFANIQLPRVNSFIPTIEAVIVIADLITSALLFAQFSIVRRSALLVLASAYLLTGLIVISHPLTFPGAFSPTGLLGAGLQSSAWLYLLWKVSLPVAVIVYVLLKDGDSSTSLPHHSPEAVIGCSVAAVIGIACVLTWVAIAGERFLPKISLNGVEESTVTRHFVAGMDMSLTAVAFVLLWLRFRSVLDLWLMVVCFTLLLEIAIAIMLVNTSFSLGFYATRFYALIATILVLLLLLSETTILYASLASSVTNQRREREARQIAMDALAASIAHEVNQPLGAMVANTNAGLRWLTNETPDLDKARAAFQRVVSDGHRAGQVIRSVRAMFTRDVHGRVWLSVNDIVREAVAMVEVDLRTQGVSVSTALRDGLPQLLVDRGQLQQVFLNLIMNAVEAMSSVTGRVRSLRITSEINFESSGVVVTVEDSGTGIDKKNKDRVFETFFSTKSSGTGMGLTICRSIIESHGGSLQASANDPYGTIFHVALPLTA